MYALPYEDTVVMLLVALSNKVSNKAGQYACAFVGRKDTVTFVDTLLRTRAKVDFDRPRATRIIYSMNDATTYVLVVATCHCVCAPA